MHGALNALAYTYAIETSDFMVFCVRKQSATKIIIVYMCRIKMHKYHVFYSVIPPYIVYPKQDRWVAKLKFCTKAY